MNTTSSMLGMALLVTSVSVGATPETDADKVFDWAESTYAQLFSAHAASTSALGYYYRCYASSVCLGARDGKLYFYDGKQISAVGSVADYLAKIAPAQTVAPTVPAERKPYEIQVVGDDAFKSKVTNALTLLKQKSPEVYDRVIKYIAVFRQASRSGMRAYDNPPVFEIGDATASATTTWFASAIAHDATHSQLYNDYRDAHPGQQVPDDTWIGQPAEVTCMAFQLATLKAIGAPTYEVDYLAKLSDGSSNYWDNYSGRFWGM